MSQVMFIIRGIQGSGKTTLARKLASEHGAIVISADGYFPEGTDRIRMSTDQWGAARVARLADVREALNNKRSLVIDGLHTHYPDYKMYVEMITNLGGRCEIVRPTTPWAWDPRECLRRSSHPIALSTIERTLRNFQEDDFPVENVREPKKALQEA